MQRRRDTLTAVAANEACQQAQKSPTRAGAQLTMGQRHSDGMQCTFCHSKPLPLAPVHLHWHGRCADTLSCNGCLVDSKSG